MDIKKMALLRLFKGYVIDNNLSTDSKDKEIKLKEALSKGLLFTDNIPEDVLTESIKMYGKDKEDWNQAFHKSFATVRDTDMKVLILQQLFHYITTYGFEEMGVYDQSLVYIPKEKLEIPELEENIPLIVIQPLTDEEIKEKLLVLLNSGIALSKETVEDVMALSDYIKDVNIGNIRNREVKTALYSKYDYVPDNNMDFLRYLIYKTTNKTLLIKNSEMIRSIKEADTELYFSLLSKYVKDNSGYIKLAQIFLRYKDLFLAFKRPETNPNAKNINKIINKISKYAKTYHIPLDVNILDHLTEIKDIDYITDNIDTIQNELSKVSTFRIIRILNILNYRKLKNVPMLYRIRNGKSYVKDSCLIPNVNIDAIEKLYNIVLGHLCNRITPLVKGKNIYIPKGVNYMVPTTEKQFIDNIPGGTYIELDKEDIVIGIHWKNLENERVDLDLHLTSTEEQFGWSSQYRDNYSNIYYSGDVTDAIEPLGATEVFFISKNEDYKQFLLTCNEYTSNIHPVPYELVVAKAKRKDIEKNYIINPNNIIARINSTMEPGQNQKVLGLVRIDDTIRFYYNNFTEGNKKVTTINNTVISTSEYLDNYSKCQLQLRKLLELCGANICDQPNTEKLEEVITTDSKNNKTETLYKKVNVAVDVNLSLETITKETIIKLLSNK